MIILYGTTIKKPKPSLKVTTNLYIKIYRYNLEECIEQISCELSPNSDADLFEKCAQYFVQKENFDAAVKLLASAKKVSAFNKLYENFDYNF